MVRRILKQGWVKRSATQQIIPVLLPLQNLLFVRLPNQRYMFPYARNRESLNISNLLERRPGHVLQGCNEYIPHAMYMLGKKDKRINYESMSVHDMPKGFP